MSTVAQERQPVEINEGQVLVPKVEMTHTFLPRCANCHAPHPLARKPAMAAEHCPDCGSPSTMGPTVVIEEPVLTGFYGWLATRLLKIGQRLRSLAKED